jgi:NAD(P)-dependent dehydrogenase (short-subunit alcohol dehydrogenase family)
LLLHYLASKAGMIGLTRTLAREVGADGITVNAVTPGAIQTESELELFPDQAGIATWLAAEQAVKRRGLPTDVAGAVAFLASDAASFISGQTINVDGGWAMH